MGKGNDDRSWLVRAVPALIVGLAVVAMAAGMLVASRAGVTRHPSKQVSFGFFDVLIVYATPTAELVVAGLLTTLSFVILVVGLDAWAADRVTNPARRASDASGRPLRDEVTDTPTVGSIAVIALIPARQFATAVFRSRRIRGNTCSGIKKRPHWPATKWARSSVHER